MNMPANAQDGQIYIGKDPRRFFTNAFVKIERFKGDTDLHFQYVEEGN